MSKKWLQSVALMSAMVGWGCSSSSDSGGGGAGGSSKSSSASGGGQSGSSSGGSSASGGSSSSSSSSSGGSSAVGGSSSKAGSSSEGGSSTGGKTGTGTGTGGTGGKTGTGTGTGTGGKTGTGGDTGTGGGTGTGGTGTGGKTGTGGSTGTGGTSGGGGAIDTTGPVTVQLSQTRQTIDGFGINNNWKPALTDEEADVLFDPNKGLGLTILRIGMNPDGSLGNKDSAADWAKAKARGAKYLIGSVWSPPKDCKTNNNTQKGGFVKDTCYGTWSDAIVKFAKANGLYAMSAGNEPDYASCASTKGPPCNDADYDTTLYTGKQMAAWVKVLGPKLKEAGIKLISPEASEWIHTWSNLSATGSTVAGKPNSSDPLNCGCFSNTTVGVSTANCAAACMQGDGYDYGHWMYKDKDAWAAVDILGVHQYDSQVAEPWSADVNGGKPDKPIWQTEMSGVKYWPEAGPSTDINNGVAVAGWLHNALTVGEANAWLWWWLRGESTNEGLFNGNTDTKRHYTFGNYTKFLRPGYVRVDMTGSVPTDVLLSAYKSEDGSTVAVVAINKGTGEAKVPITIDGGKQASCTPHVTSGATADNLKAGTAVEVTDGVFTATLISKSVTTFVCK